MKDVVLMESVKVLCTNGSEYNYTAYNKEIFPGMGLECGNWYRMDYDNKVLEIKDVGEDMHIEYQLFNVVKIRKTYLEG